LKDYYQILRVSRQASPQEIKRAFRRLAIVFHPDKNPSTQSSSLFQEINEAHQILSDPEMRIRYDQLLSASYSSTPVDVPPQRYHRDPAYRRSQQAGYKPRPAQPSERLLMMAHFLKYLRLISLVGVGWCGFLMLDYVLPPKLSDEIVLSEAHKTNSWRTRHSPYVVITSKSHQFPVSSKGNDFFVVGSHATVVTSRVLNILMRVESENKGFTINSLPTVFGTFIFMPVILLMLSIAGLVIKKGIEFRFSFEVAICMFLFFNAIFLAMSIL
jgi:DnaJ domain